MSHFSTAYRSLCHRVLLVVAGGITGSLLLAGCVTAPTDDITSSSAPTTLASPSATAPPASTGVSAPTSEAEALAAAQDVVAEEMTVITEVHSVGATDLTPLATVATGPELDSLTQTANEVARQQWVVSGALVFEYHSGYASELVGSDGTEYPFSSVTLTGCQDSSGYNITLPDGSSPLRSPELRSINEVTVIRDPGTGTWLVQDTDDTDETC